MHYFKYFTYIHIKLRSQSEITQVMAAKKRKYLDDYLQFVFVSICIGTVGKL